MMFRFSTLLIFGFLSVCVVWLLEVTPAHSAACCAVSGAVPSMILGDESAQFSLSAARGTVIGDAPVHGIPVFRNGSSSEVTHTLLVSGAILLSDLFQAGASVPIVRHGMARTGGESTHTTGLGDLRLNAAYEFLPEWTYSVWKPRGFMFLQFTIPTGTSIYDSQAAGGVDALGKGFYSLGVGSILVKRWSVWDAYAISEAHFSFTRTFQSYAGNTILVGSGWGGSCSLGVGVSPGASDLRIGLRIQPLYESPKDVVADGNISPTNYQLLWNTALETTYLVSTAWAVNFTYTDQTLLGPAVNTTLSRMFAVALQHKWQR